ncbi:hypothetical protein [Agromyces mangrovi Wang et al. 2018]|uniref:hypothetical protein n=1 Tax=Agromyces mangrovi TaxID=1858653 RepID=UPI0025725D1D|nr:hypothetical protein [Agromyces mangrovi]BDZ64859.1 hypothetical protein GCM10025877_17970 [Agromyces mangrovi]
MFVSGFNGLLVLAIYLVIIAVIAAVLYFVVRLAVLHALQAHTRWVEGRLTE